MRQPRHGPVQHAHLHPRLIRGAFMPRHRLISYIRRDGSAAIGRGRTEAVSYLAASGECFLRFGGVQLVQDSGG